MCTNAGVEGNHCCGVFFLFFGQETLKKVEIGPRGERFGVIVGAATHQQKGSDVGDLVELHEQPQCLFVVAAVLAVDGEALPLQGKKEASG